jgi:hypothetical protein
MYQNTRCHITSTIITRIIAKRKPQILKTHLNSESLVPEIEPERTPQNLRLSVTELQGNLAKYESKWTRGSYNFPA